MSEEEKLANTSNGLPYGVICEHGSLKRQCRVCELESENAALRAQTETLATALEEIKNQDAIENALDPQWASRIAKEVLAAYREQREKGK